MLHQSQFLFPYIFYRHCPGMLPSSTVASIKIPISSSSGTACQGIHRILLRPWGNILFELGAPREGSYTGINWPEPWRIATLNTHLHTYIHTYIHTFIHTYTHTHIQTHTYIHTYTHIHTYMHTYIQIYMHTHIHSYRHTHTDYWKSL